MCSNRLYQNAAQRINTDLNPITIHLSCVERLLSDEGPKPTSNILMVFDRFFFAHIFSLVAMMLSLVYVYGAVTFSFFLIFIKYFMLLFAQQNALHATQHPRESKQTRVLFAIASKSHLWVIIGYRDKFRSLENNVRDL